MSISSSSFIRKFLGRCYSPKICWSDFLFPSSLQLASILKILLEPIEGLAERDTIQLGLQEALVNAVSHGNRGDPNKLVRVRMVLTPKWLVWQIQDQGVGIPLESRRSSLPEDIEAESGRGLFLIHHCFDDVRWSQNGNRLQVSKRR